MSFVFVKQKTAYEMRISDWSSDVCSSDLHGIAVGDHRDAMVAQMRRRTDARQTFRKCYARSAANPSRVERSDTGLSRRKPMPTRTSKQLVSEANAVVESLPPGEAVKLIGNPDVRFVDIREHAEVAKSGLVAGAVHVPRGLLEFQVDPESR